MSMGSAIRAAAALALVGWLAACSGGFGGESPRPDSSPCRHKSDCQSGVCLQETRYGEATGWVGGMCTRACGEGAPCGSQTTCVPLGDDAWCLPRCSADEDCRQGYVCNPTFGACLPDCRLGWECGAGFACGADGLCTVPPSPFAAPGDPCKGPADCATGVCLEASDGWPDGLCTAPCATDVPCDEGQSCVPLGDAAWCLPGCAADADCRAGYLCNPALGACVPDCRLGWDCGAGFACGADGLCTVPPGTFAAPGDPCKGPADCATGVCLEASDGWPEGLCAAPCAAGVPCDEGQSCVPLGDAAWCLPGCASDADCRAGYLCNPALGACVPDCRLGWDCGTGFACGDDGLCTVPPGTFSPLGGACNAAADCATGVCFGASDGWPGGTCSAPCGGGATCPAGASCVPLGGEAWCLPGCGSDADCRAGYLCNPALGACVPDCRLGWDCGTGFACGSDGLCTVPPGTFSPLGGACNAAADCATGVCFEASDGWPGGTCSAPCGGGATCPAGASCVPLGGEAWCLPGCASDADCRTGYLCNPALGACVPDCRLGWDCGAGFACGADGLCTVPPGTFSPLGGACNAASDCVTGVCFAASDGWPGGTCSAPCGGGATCPAGASCVPLGGEAWCLPGCAADADCRAGYLCNPALGACVPDCRLGWDCGAGFACGADGLCTVPPGTFSPLGGACNAAADCVTGVCFEASDGWPGGTCSAPCGGGATCPAGASCVPLGGAAWCLPGCASDADCRAGYLCNPALGACVPDCRLGWECGAGFTCGSDGLCTVSSPSPTVVALGDACNVGDTCVSGGTCVGASAGVPGVCSVPCSSMGPGGGGPGGGGPGGGPGGKSCPSGLTCSTVLGSGWCLKPCYGFPPTCAAGLVCTQPANVCIP